MCDDRVIDRIHRMHLSKFYINMGLRGGFLGLCTD